jgi:hypothetical protein
MSAMLRLLLRTVEIGEESPGVQPPSRHTKFEIRNTVYVELGVPSSKTGK